jgi:YVTN family beta-propeller protein
VAISPDGRRLYVTNSGDDTVFALRLPDHALLSTIQVAWEPRGIVIKP